MSMKGIAAFLTLLLVINTTAFTQIGNTNGQYDEAIKEAYSILELIYNTNKKELKSRFNETNFQSRREYLKNIKSSKIKWVQSILKQYGNPKKEDILLSGWETVAKSANESTFSVNITFILNSDNKQNKNNSDHISINFYRNKDGIYKMNGLLMFKKNELIRVKNIEDSSSK